MKRLKLWTEQESAACLKSWARGASFSIIEQELGGAKSRSAIAGYLRRQGQLRDGRSSTETLPPFRGGWPPKAGPRPVAGTPRRPRAKATPKQPKPTSPTLRQLIQQTKPKFDPARPMATIDTRLSDGCTFPFGERPPYEYCNQVNIAGTSFCAHHCKLVYQPAR